MTLCENWTVVAILMLGVSVYVCGDKTTSSEQHEVRHATVFGHEPSRGARAKGTIRLRLAAGVPLVSGDELTLESVGGKRRRGICVRLSVVEQCRNKLHPRSTPLSQSSVLLSLHFL